MYSCPNVDWIAESVDGCRFLRLVNGLVYSSDVPDDEESRSIDDVVEAAARPCCRVARDLLGCKRNIEWEVDRGVIYVHWWIWPVRRYGFDFS